MIDRCLDLERFVRGEFDAAAFPHQEHVRMGFEMLRRHDFAETAFHFSSTLRAMAVRVGKPQAFHQTVTIAFLWTIRFLQYAASTLMIILLHGVLARQSRRESTPRAGATPTR